MKPILVALVGLFVLTGCNQPRLDTTTEESFKASSEKVRGKLPEDQQETYDEALAAVALSQFDLGELMSGSNEQMAAKMYAALNGLTGPEVLEKGRQLQAQAKRDALKRLEDQIDKLKAKQQDAERAKTTLRPFEVTAAAYEREPERFGNDQPILAITVKNGLDVPVSHAFFTGTLSSPDRSVPWLVEVFNYDIPGGIEPGETLSWRLAPNRFGAWGSVDAPDDAVLSVEVYKLEDAQGKPIATANLFTREDQNRLAELIAQHTMQSERSEP